jgi:hypothetical protein
MYKGIIKWNDTFDGEVSENTAYFADTNARALNNALMSMLEANDELVFLEIRPEDE